MSRSYRVSGFSLRSLLKVDESAALVQLSVYLQTASVYIGQKQKGEKKQKTPRKLK